MAEITNADLVELQSLAGIWSVKAGTLGYKESDGTYEEVARARQAESVARGEFTSKVASLFHAEEPAEDSPEPTEAAGGVKSESDDAAYERRTIETLEDLESLPLQAVVLDEREHDAFQKSTSFAWDGLGRSWRPGQVPLPATLIFSPNSGWL